MSKDKEVKKPTREEIEAVKKIKQNTIASQQTVKK